MAPTTGGSYTRKPPSLRDTTSSSTTGARRMDRSSVAGGSARRWAATRCGLTTLAVPRRRHRHRIGTCHTMATSTLSFASTPRSQNPAPLAPAAPSLPQKLSRTGLRPAMAAAGAAGGPRFDAQQQRLPPRLSASSKPKRLGSHTSAGTQRNRTTMRPRPRSSEGSSAERIEGKSAVAWKSPPRPGRTAVRSGGSTRAGTSAERSGGQNCGAKSATRSGRLRLQVAVGIGVMRTGVASTTFRGVEMQRRRKGAPDARSRGAQTTTRRGAAMKTVMFSAVVMKTLTSHGVATRMLIASAATISPIDGKTRSASGPTTKTASAATIRSGGNARRTRVARRLNHNK
mmetsp:Transcript_42323/g.116744  ORF Transcript_42323/g.116744 Transcript_42323/m.116744 type:complete len:343 (+) Transcript_42323:407-1435(+)